MPEQHPSVAGNGGEPRAEPETPPAEPAPDGSAGPGGDRVADLEAQLTDLEDRWRRALADFDNLRKRVARDADQQRADERARVLREWLPVLDNLDLALEHAGSDESPLVE